MKRDLESRDDIEVVLKAFYQQATQDSLIGRFFTEVIQLDIQATHSCDSRFLGGCSVWSPHL